MKSIFEEMGGTYRQEGDYLLPNLSTTPCSEEYTIGKYGRMRKRYLKEHRRNTYTELLITGKLQKHLSDIEQSCIERMKIIEAELMKQEGVTEALKASDPIEWVRRRNSIHNRAEETVLSELIYT